MQAIEILKQFNFPAILEATPGVSKLMATFSRKLQIAFN